MPSKFHEDAIVLSGVTGTLIKTSIIGKYYKFWQSVVSGGKKHHFKFPSTIIELNAGTSEVYIEGIAHTTFGSAGHALHMKYGPESSEEVNYLTIILVEESPECLKRLINVILRRWPNTRLMKVNTGDYSFYFAKDMSLFIFDSYEKIPLEAFKGRTLGNCLLFFDPLRATDWNMIENIAYQRIYEPYLEGTEFIIFLFTSDWIRGRQSLLSLPSTSEETLWSEKQKRTVVEADIAFGDRNWLSIFKTGKTSNELENNLVKYYCNKLHRFFRFVIPLPFSPKKTERYDLFFCTNHLTGANSICDFYRRTFLKFFGNNFPHIQNLQESELFLKFKELYPDTSQLNRKWEILWCFLHAYPESILDQYERSLREETLESPQKIARILEWLEKKGFIQQICVDDWTWFNRGRFPQYIANWKIIRRRLVLKKPEKFQPIDPETIKRTVIEIYDKRDWPEEIIEELEMREEWEARRKELLTLQGELIEEKKDCAFRNGYCNHIECPIEAYNEFEDTEVICPDGLAYHRPECPICEDCEYLEENEDLSPYDKPFISFSCGFFNATIDDEEE